MSEGQALSEWVEEADIRATRPTRRSTPIRRTAKDEAVIDEAKRLSRESREAHFPTRYQSGRNHKWACGGCDYWTGYGGRTRVSKQIIAHCRTKNAETPL